MDTTSKNNPPPWQAFGRQVVQYSRMIKLSHSVFALPFVLVAVIWAQRSHPLQWSQVIWIVIAAVAARSAAMGFNRIADAAIDERNPRTQQREIPAKRLSPTAAAIFVGLSSLIFIGAAAQLGSLCLWAAIPVLLVLFGYSYTKRFTWLAHFYLGFAIGLAPLGAWIAITNTLDLPILLLALALMTYIAGFDILYACQDHDFDIQAGLHSLPARFGLDRALQISVATHWVTFAALMCLFFIADLTLSYLAAVVIIGVLLVWEHRLVRPDDLSRIHIAFFHLNSAISLTLLAGFIADEMTRRWLIT
jgi:4-hydroxybenzoate polyprenyltransferase